MYEILKFINGKKIDSFTTNDPVGEVASFIDKANLTPRDEKNLKDSFRMFYNLEEKKFVFVCETLEGELLSLEITRIKN